MKVHDWESLWYWLSHFWTKMSHLAPSQGSKGHDAASDVLPSETRRHIWCCLPLCQRDHSWRSHEHFARHCPWCSSCLHNPLWSHDGSNGVHVWKNSIQWGWIHEQSEQDICQWKAVDNLNVALVLINKESAHFERSMVDAWKREVYSEEKPLTPQGMNTMEALFDKCDTSLYHIQITANIRNILMTNTCWCLRRIKLRKNPPLPSNC